jgi:hypothetical protein
MIFIPKTIWERLLQELRKRRRKVEQIAYLDGIDNGQVSVVTTLTFPYAILGTANFSVPAQAMSQAGQHLGVLTRVAQVHTHPGEWVGHSGVDCDWAYSQHDGAVSIVLPNYGKSVRDISQVGIHVCRRGTWHEIRPVDRVGFLQILPSLFDFR